MITEPSPELSLRRVRHRRASATTKRPLGCDVDGADRAARDGEGRARAFRSVRADRDRGQRRGDAARDRRWRFAVHLTAAVDELGSGRAALGDFNVDSDRNGRVGMLAGYDRAALTEPRWPVATLCGRVWAIMVGGDDGAIGRSGEVAFAPTCC